MVDSSNKTHFPSSSASSMPNKPLKSKLIFTRYFFSKSLIIILVLLVFSYFPSQVPEIFKETTIVTKLWDLIYLLVIGIAVCYGLFSRKIDSVDSSDDNIGEKETYLSGISHISSIFEDGIQNSYGFEENSLFEESSFCEIGDKFVKSDGKKLNQCVLGESVVINDENYVLGHLGRQKTTKQNKPLCLPVRNLGSRSLDSAAGKSAVVDNFSSSRDEYQKGKFKGLVPIKLEKRFKETDSDSDSDSRTPLNWRSKSMRLEKRGDMFTTDANASSDSVEVLDFEDLNLQSKNIQNLSEKQELKGVEMNHRYRKPYLNSETSFMELDPQESRTDQLSATETLKDFNDTLEGSFLKDFGKNKVDNGKFDSKHNSLFVKSKSQSSGTESNMEMFKSMSRKEGKEAPNTYKTGKSVRTNRSKEQVVELKVTTFQSQTDDQVEPRIDVMNTKADELSDNEPHSGEVDRKAEEFIAKFREQIRLQKVASARKLNLL